MRESIVAAQGQVGIDGVGVNMVWPGIEPSPDMSHRYNQAQAGNLRTGAPARPVVAMNLTDALGVLTLLGDFVMGAEIRAAVGR